MELSDFITVVVGVLTIVGFNMMLFGVLATLGDNERIPRVLVKYGAFIMVLALNIFMGAIIHLAVTEGIDNITMEDNCRVMFNIY